MICSASSTKANVPSGLNYQEMIAEIDVSNTIDSTDGDSITVPQTSWVGKVAVPPTTGTSLVIQNTHVNMYSNIFVSPENSTVGSGGVTVTSQGAGTFTVSLPKDMGTGAGSITALNYQVVNPGSNGESSTTPQTNWAGRVSVPSSVGSSLVIQDTHVNVGSAIIITPVSSTATSGSLTVTSVSAGTFTVSSKNAMGSGDGAMTAINYMIVNH
jgi:hypothetical protein